MKPSFPVHTPAQVAEAFAAGRQAQPAWAALPYRHRSAALKRVRDLVVARADALARTITEDNGKVLVDALAAEVVPAALCVDYYRKAAKKLLKPRRVSGGNLLLANKRSRLHAVPYGVIGIISPWNYPFSIPFGEVVMALLTGNAVVLKVASDTLAVGQALADLFGDAGLPPGVFSYVNLPGSQAGPAFLAAGVDKLFFTGSTEVGRTIMALAAPRLTPLVLELGGNDAAIVRADADLDRAASGILWSGFSNAGQSCGGAQRILVHRSVHEPFLGILKRKVEALRVGPGTDFGSDIGAMTSAKQKKAVEDQVAACLAAGARVAAQSPVPPGPGNFLPAVVLTEVTPDMPVMRDEVFGPVLAVLAVDDDEEALQIANASPLGLTGSVWSRNHREARALALRIHAGALMVNDHLMSHGLAETPWGGFGDSGIGRTHGEPGLAETVRLQVVVDDLLPGATKNIWWHPYSERVYRGLKGLIQLLYGPGLANRLRAIPKVLGIFFRYWEK
jgi:succinate-semialdehyde dehydrogenase/glutarate-semialdehyde dehydrogenase